MVVAVPAKSFAAEDARADGRNRDRCRAGSPTALSGVANQVFLQCAQRTERPAAPSAASSIW